MEPKADGLLGANPVAGIHVKPCEPPMDPHQTGLVVLFQRNHLGVFIAFFGPVGVARIVVALTQIAQADTLAYTVPQALIAAKGGLQVR